MGVWHGKMTYILDHDKCKNFECEMGKRLLRLYQHLWDEDKHGYNRTPNDNGKSFKEWMEED